MPHPKRQKEIRITTEGYIYLTILAFISVGAVLRNVNLLILMAGMMFAPLLINWRIGVHWLKSLSAERRLPYRLHARQLVNVQWMVRNQAKIPAWSLEIRDLIMRVEKSENEDSELSEPSSVLSSKTDSTKTPSLWRRAYKRLRPHSSALDESNVKVDLWQVNGGRSEVGTFRVSFPERGRYRIGPATLTTRFPFGLLAVQLRMSQEKNFFVAPAIGTLTPTWDQRLRSSVVGSDSVQRRRGLDEDEFYGLRPWRSGDSRKQIHWRTSAKSGNLIVKQHEQPDNRDFALLLDLHLPSDCEKLPATMATNDCETALSFAATVLLQIGTAVQGRIAVGICGRRSVVCSSRNQRELVDQAMRELAVAQPAQHPALANSLIELSQSVSSSTPIYIISTRAAFNEAEILAELASTGSPQQTRKLKTAWPATHWLTTDSSEFAALFSSQSPTDQADFTALVEKWRQPHVTH